MVQKHGAPVFWCPQELNFPKAKSSKRFTSSYKVQIITKVTQHKTKIVRCILDLDMKPFHIRVFNAPSFYL